MDKISETRYVRNFPSVTGQDQKKLSESRVLVAGCGGIGGYVIEYLSRLGIGGITVVDGDMFDESNLNRQLLCTEKNIGLPKASVAAQRMSHINSSVTITPVNEFLSAGNASMLVSGHDLVIDALDNIPARLLLEDACEENGLIIVHGAVEGWNVQASVISPGSRVLHRLYEGSHHDSSSSPEGKSTLSMVPALCAAIECAEAVKILTGKPSALSGKLFLFDMSSMTAFDVPFE